MDSSSEITVLVHYNGFVIQNTDKGVIFMFSEQA